MDVSLHRFRQRLLLFIFLYVPVQGSWEHFSVSVSFSKHLYLTASVIGMSQERVLSRFPIPQVTEQDDQTVHVGVGQFPSRNINQNKQRGYNIYSCVNKDYMQPLYLLIIQLPKLEEKKPPMFNWKQTPR